MKQEDYVTFEQAKALKELGFDGECRAYYYDTKEISGNLIPYNYNSRDIGVISSPTLSEAQKWLREVKGIDIDVCRILGKPTKHVYKDYIVYGGRVVAHIERDNETYEQALSAGIDKAIELIKEGEL